MLHYSNIRPGSVVLCDYDLVRSARIPDEMAKRRPVVVLSPRRRRAAGPYIVVPFSTSRPSYADDRHVRIEAGSYEFLRADVDSWVKCEFACSVGARRLDRPRRGGQYFSPRVSAADLRSILRATACAIGGVDLLFDE